MIKELLPIVVGAAMEGEGCQVPVRQRGHSGSAELGKEQDGEGDAPLRSLFFFLAFNGITMWGGAHPREE